MATIIAAAFILGACGDAVGGGVPECYTSPRNLQSVTPLMQLQAVPDATWGPCINGLLVGWDYVAQEAESDLARFWLHNDLGKGSVEVTLTPACEVSGVGPALLEETGVERFVEVGREPSPLPIAVVPVAQRHAAYAADVVFRASQAELAGQSVEAYAGTVIDEASVRIEAALSRGHSVIVVDDRQVARNTVELRLPNKAPETDITLDEALDEIEETIPEAEYRATWYHRFDGGCITYVIDAKGLGVSTIVDDVDLILGFNSLADLRALGLEFGYEL